MHGGATTWVPCPFACHEPGKQPSIDCVLIQVQLQRERLELSPVFSTAMQHGDHMTGYIRLVNFSQKAAPEMRHAIADLQV